MARPSQRNGCGRRQSSKETEEREGARARSAPEKAAAVSLSLLVRLSIGAREGALPLSLSALPIQAPDLFEAGVRVYAG
jgi:hypothetical protein